MTPSKDRIASPTNGHRPAMGEPEADDQPVESGDLPRPSASPVPSVSPIQLAAGFGIIAALILIVLGRRRGRRD